MRFLLLNGPNLNLLGTREPDVYGSDTLADIEQTLQALAAEFGDEIRAFQSTVRASLSTHSKRALGGPTVHCSIPGDTPTHR